MSNKAYGLRLAAGLLIAATAFACQALLDTEGLNSSPLDAADSSSSLDGAATDGNSGEGSVADGGAKDLGACVSGAPCIVPGQKGLCALGNLVCSEGGVGHCQQTVSPQTEVCDGQDADCDGNPDDKEVSAHTACTGFHYCAGTKCANGCWQAAQCAARGGDTCNMGSHTCLCGTAILCTGTTDTCATGHVCKCGTGPACQNGNHCVSGACRCGSGAACMAPARCVNNTSCQSPDSGVVQPDVGVPDVGAPDVAVPDQSSVVDSAS